MAWAISKREVNGVPGGGPLVTIIMDAGEDVSGLPTGYAPGSVAIEADTDLPTYVLNASGEWTSID